MEDAARRKPGNVLIYQKLSDAALKAGNKAATHRYRAEKFYAQGDLEPAIHQLEIALRQPGIDYHDASKIQVRLDAIKQEEKDTEEKVIQVASSELAPLAHSRRGIYKAAGIQ